MLYISQGNERDVCESTDRAGVFVMCGAVVLTSETPNALPLPLHKHTGRGLVI